jgi:hypothetical protein
MLEEAPPQLLTCVPVQQVLFASKSFSHALAKTESQPIQRP